MPHAVGGVQQSVDAKSLLRKLEKKAGKLAEPAPDHAKQWVVGEYYKTMSMSTPWKVTAFTAKGFPIMETSAGDEIIIRPFKANWTHVPHTLKTREQQLEHALRAARRSLYDGPCSPQGERQ